ncbi:MAG: UDP-N-acetylmuramoyl-L-alanine--D-glutamate ligase [Candidatus Berkelbacteria bacterium]|nr:UDP-N-acetylmuramoyl-L-alanine--D-glutamate ligase [Candidatus Berkelbacteria bacterium]
MINDFSGKKIAVLGRGVEGISSALFLMKRGALVTVLDCKEGLSQEDTKILRYKDIKIKTGKDYLKNLSDYDIIVRSPGVKRDLPEILEAEKKGVVVTSQTNIFFDLCPCPIVGVTGTKGKGTTASLIYEMLKTQNINAYLGGNMGKPPFDFLDKLNVHDFVILELSSFQLLDLKKSSASPAGGPHIAVMLMATSEHLDYHKDVYEYISAKRNLLRLQNENDFAVINKDYLASRESDIETKSKVFFVSREEEVGEGCFVKNGKVILRLCAESLPHIANDTRRGQDNSQIQNRSLSESRLKSDALLEEKPTPTFSSFASGQPSSADFIEEEIATIDKILLPGEHNLENVCAAVMAARLVGVSNRNVAEVLKTFKGLEHRLELVGEVNGVKYYDDSFSTTPETAIAAIKAFKNPEILILGGSSKGSDFTELGQVIFDAKNIKAIIGIGLEWQRIKAQFQISNFKFPIIEGLKDMRSIVQKAAEMAEMGDVVLLSPACASFDMFKNYKDRGEQFKKEVNSLKG